MTPSTRSPLTSSAASAAGDQDTDRPNAARIYSCLLGDSANFAADRRAASHLLNIAPGIAADAYANRAFVARAICHLTSAGVRQFLDLGAGLPTAGNLHDLAQRDTPSTRVVYVDHDPVVVAAWQQTLGDAVHVRVVHADIRNPAEVLASAEVADLLDLSEPIGLVATAVLHYVSDVHEPGELLRAYRAALAPGSHLVLSHGTWDHLGVGQYINIAELYERVGAPLTLRTLEEITALLDGWNLLAPADDEPTTVVPVGEWRWADDLVEPDPAACHLLGAVACLDDRNSQ
ncbi:SAM-dependent methyltransferase [Cryptosporangium phraense]|uniref:SAM-dependent methyltransferase n=1 Tax=Cryptosporangium phraense TaxID=2593070 RepID=A0A545AKN0_9ACTN|nr:SAM-dependent methyltransferase [Cryptosporangium phraense]TQS41820.1 hypothetical protein FL583_27695 [Cryptosporangium phraense]